MVSEHSNPLTETAMQYASWGFEVFPARFTRVFQKGRYVKIKKPLTINGFKNASTDPDEVRRMFEGESEALTLSGLTNEADIIGMVHNRFLILDIDVKHDKPGLANFEKIRHLLPEPIAHVETSSGGFHLWFPNPNPRKIPHERHTDYLLGVDLLMGPKGWVAVPPSTGYRFLKGSMESVRDALDF